MHINAVKITKKENACPYCGKKSEFTSKDSVFFCKNCRKERNDLSLISSKGGYHEHAIKSDVEKRNNFEKYLLRKQGKQIVAIPFDLYQELNNYFSYHNLPTSFSSRTLPFDNYGRKEGTTKDMMYEALRSIGYSDHNDDIDLICQQYWGWKLIDLSPFYDDIMKDYDSIRSVFDCVKGARKSSLSMEYQLFWQLKRLGIPCSKDDFKIVETSDTIDAYEKIREEICRLLSWDFFPIL